MNFDKVLEIIYNHLPNILLGLSIFILFWFFGKLIQYAVNKILTGKNPNTNIARVNSGIIQKIIVILGFITALGTVGINVPAIVAGLGLTGFAFGIAFKDML